MLAQSARRGASLAVRTNASSSTRSRRLRTRLLTLAWLQRARGPSAISSSRYQTLARPLVFARPQTNALKAPARVVYSTKHRVRRPTADRSNIPTVH